MNRSLLLFFNIIAFASLRRLRYFYRLCFATAITVLFTSCAIAQDNRTQYNSFLANSYFSVNLGYLQVPFTGSSLESGHTVGSITVPPITLRAVLFGHHFGKGFSAQVSYMRPVRYSRFNNIDGDNADHFVWMHYGSLSIRKAVPLTKRLALSVEGGLGIVTRKGFMAGGDTVVRSGSYPSFFAGAALEYKLNERFDLLLGTNRYGSNKSLVQPSSYYHSLGFRYNMRPLTPEKVAENSSGGFIFPKQMIQVGYTTNKFGYAPNNFLSKKVPIFWGGGIELRRGLTLRYQRNLFHTKKVFAFNIGVSGSWWQSRLNREEFYSLALAPIFQFNVLRTKPFDFYLFYSVAGPSYLSKTVIDGKQSGKHFTFQDFMGLGFFTGKSRKLNLELNINHYSNGNIFTENAGLKIPMTFTVGMTF